MTRERVVEIGRITRESSSARSRVTASVDGIPVTFESPDAELSASAEAFASTFFIAALHHRARLRLAEPVSAEWRANLERMATRLRAWWRYPVLVPEGPIDPPRAPSAGGPTSRPEIAGATALFFSGGVDSFHRLLRGKPVDWLVTIAGFDYRLDDAPRVASVESSLRLVAAATNTRAVIVRTNAREHPLVRDAPWPRVHGGLMAGVGHLLAPAVRRMTIAASAPGDWKYFPWGSHPEIDPLWSSPRVTFVHEEAGLLRGDKVRSIAFEPMIREHLRVCWQNLEPTGNCSRCAKCLLVMLLLEECGALADSRVFPDRDRLLAGLSRLRKAPDRWHTYAEVARSPRLDPVLAEAAHGVVRRSRRLRRLDIRTRRAVVKWWVTRGPFARREGVSRP